MERCPNRANRALSNGLEDLGKPDVQALRANLWHPAPASAQKSQKVTGPGLALAVVLRTASDAEEGQHCDHP